MKPILVTGSPRSGTTWIGKMISLSQEVAYVHEAYNFLIRKNLPADPDPYHFLVSPLTHDHVNTEYSQLLNLEFSLWEQFSKKKSFFNLLNSLHQSLRFRSFAKQDIRLLLKDQFVVFSVPWFVDQFQTLPVILIRHPGPVYDSFTRLNWRVNFKEIFEDLPPDDELRDLINQTGILEEKSPSLEKEVGLLWNLIYYRVKQFEETYPEWLFLRYEDIIFNLETTFRKIFTYLGLHLSDDIIAKIYHYTINGSFPREQTRSRSPLSREDLLNGWKTRIPEKSKGKLMGVIDEQVFSNYYKHSSWDDDRKEY